MGKRNRFVERHLLSGHPLAGSELVGDRVDEWSPEPLLQLLVTFPSSETPLAAQTIGGVEQP